MDKRRKDKPNREIRAWFALNGLNMTDVAAEMHIPTSTLCNWLLQPVSEELVKKIKSAGEKVVISRGEEVREVIYETRAERPCI